ncbi:MAG TPA: ABC transporter ATP-binding protein [Trebonia sp.]|nr:ABC transporter ATP-binding protein [Trebonia sp.]
MAETVTLSDVTKTYPGASTRALDGVSLTVDPGTFLVLLGPSGSGKTTLLRCLAGIERVSSGSVAIGARTVADGRVHLPPDQRDLSMVFQDYALWPHLTARENVAFALRRRGLSRAECRARAAALLERVGLDEFAGRYPNELSGGQQQRVALARALVADTGLILCDEPLSNLDADLRERMRVEISSLVREAAATTVYITHDQAEAFALADVVGVLRDGELVQFGTPEDVYNHPATPFVARFTGLAGELPVRVASADGLTVTAAGGTIRLPGAAGDPDGLRAGDDALLAIRPTGVRVTSPDDEADHLTGTVADVAFRGRGYELAVDLPRDPSGTPGAGGTPEAAGRLTGVFARHRPFRGERIGLRLEPSGCHLFPAATPAGTRQPEEKAVAG